MTIQKITMAATAVLVCWIVPALAQVFTPPLIPPETHYVMNIKLDTVKRELSGSGSVVVQNAGKHDLPAIEFQWSDQTTPPFELTLAGTTREFTNAKEPIEVMLPAPLRPGAKLKFALRFRRPMGQLEVGWGIQHWFPCLWWGYETHASYDIAVETPADVIVGASAYRNPRTGHYSADHIRSFGLFFARGFQVKDTTAGSTFVRSIFRPDMRQCAELVVQTAADAVDFYRQRFGMYPQPSLTIIPGGSKPVGGYPYATAMVVVHGQQACSEKPRDSHWRWIAAHEVGHQYWLEHVLGKDPEQGYGWLMIGLGIWTDREYVRARGIDSVHTGFLSSYANAVRDGLNTTLEIAPEELRKLNFDYNTQVTHAKGFGIISALADIIGHDIFERVYQRVLREYTGRRLSTADFRRICEEESAQDLGWFFVPLLRTNKFASYEIQGTSTTQRGNSQVVHVNVSSGGNLMLPIPVEARFVNGDRKCLTLDRMREDQTLEFLAPAPLAEVVIDPDHEFPLVIPPPAITNSRLADLVDELPWSGGGEKPLRFYRRAVELDVRDLRVWGKLGLTLFDSHRYQESLDAFNRVVPLVAEKNPNWHFAALVWRGMLNDVLGRRDLALENYRQALQVSGNPVVQHTQFGLVLDRGWVERRLETPFIWPTAR
jgi:hypothetical protein